MNPLNLLAQWAGMLGSEPILQRLFLASLEAGGLALVVAVVIGVVRLRSPRLRCLLWLIVLLKPVVSLTVGSAIPIVRIEPPVAASTAIGAYPVAAEDAKAVGGVGRQAFPRVVLGAWLTGVILVLGYHLRSRLWLHHVIRTSKLPPLQIASRYRGTLAELGLCRGPRLMVTDALESPAIVGLARPTILLPAWLAAETDGRKLDWCMRHELTHWKWLDPLSILIRDVAVILFWFHPVAWWSGKRLVETMELACDRAMVRGSADAADYAEQLFKILQNVRERRRPAVASGLFATRTQIGKRIAALLDGSLVHLPQVTRRSAVGLLLAGGVVLSVGVGFAERAKVVSVVDSRVSAARTQGSASGPPTRIYGGSGGGEGRMYGGYGQSNGAGKNASDLANAPSIPRQGMGFAGHGSGQPQIFGGSGGSRASRKAARPNRVPKAQTAMGFGGYSKPVGEAGSGSKSESQSGMGFGGGASSKPE